MGFLVDVQVRTPTGELIEHLPVDANNAGAINDDRTAARRRTISSVITIVDPTGRLIPKYANDVLHPYSGNELWIFRGGQPLGVFGLSKPDVHVGSDGWYLELSGSDRSHRIQRAAWTDIYAITGTPNLNTAVMALLNNRMAAAGVSWPYNLSPTSATVPNTTFGLARGGMSQTDPWADVSKLTKANAEELFFDQHGVIVSQPIPDPATAPVAATYIDGVGGTIVTIERGVDIDNSFSGVLVIGDGSTVTTPVRAVVWDPVSVSLMGYVPYVYESSAITTQAQAAATAATLLPTVVGAQETMTITALADPARHASEVVSVTSERAGVTDVRYLLQQVHQPLGANATMTLSSTRQVPA